MKENRKKKEPWTKKRHAVITQIVRIFLTPYVKWKYKIKIEKYKEQGDGQYLILANHQTGFDQFFVGMSFNGPLYYLATEDIFSMGWVSKLIKWLVNPIPIKKQTTDIKAILNCIRVAKEGGSLAIFPEGNRTYSGRPAYISPAIVSLAKKLGLPILLFRIEGGYGVHPRWSDVVRKGKMRAYVSKRIEVDEYKDLSNEELAKLIEDGLFVDEACDHGEFFHEKSAEYLERAIYYCPKCGLSTFESHGDTITCKKCGLKVKYLPNLSLVSENAEFNYKYVADWYDAQGEFVGALDVTALTDKPLYRENVSIFNVIVYDHKEKIHERAIIELYGDRVCLYDGESGEVILSLTFDEALALTVLGKNKLNIYFEDKCYQIKGDARFNALKYVNVFSRYKNIKSGNEDSKFLGI